MLLTRAKKLVANLAKKHDVEIVREEGVITLQSKSSSRESRIFAFYNELKKHENKS